MNTKLAALADNLKAVLVERLAGLDESHGELTLVVKGTDLLWTAAQLRDHPQLRFEQLVDLCGVDYLAFGNRAREGARYAVVYHLLSVSRNQRLRLRVFSAGDDFPSLDSVNGIWPSANWYERETFDLFGIVFPGHPDLRRILTDYGFIGHPFRKDFPLSGYVEMRYDPDQRRVIYQPVSIEPRETVPRVVREENYANTEGRKN